MFFTCLCPGAFCQTRQFDLGGEKINISTYLQVDYSSAVSSTAPPSNTFTIPRLRCDIWGDPTPSYGYLLELEGTTSPNIIYGWIDIKTIPWFKVRFGKFYYPFGLEYTTPPSKFDTINPSDTLWKYFGYSRDIGAEVLGNVGAFKYYLSVVNGNDNKPSDDNNVKDLCGRVTYDLGSLTLGLSDYNGRAGTGEVEKSRVGGELKYNFGPFTLKGEFISGIDDRIKSQGWYAMPIFKFTSMVEGLVKVECIDPDIDEGGDLQTLVTPGINVFFDENLKLQVNYLMKSDQAIDSHSSTFTTQLQLFL